MYESARKKVKRARFSVMISASIAKDFADYCNKNNYFKQKLFAIILEEFLDKYGVPKKK